MLLYLSSIVSTSQETNISPPSTSLVKKLISVLEAVERLPLYCYNSPGSSLNLPVLCKLNRTHLKELSHS